MTRFTTIPGQIRHCGQLSRVLRHGHQEALLRLGVSAHHQLRAAFEQSYFCKAWLIDGQLSGLGGVVGSVMTPIGFIWVALSERATRFPVAIIKEARTQLDEVMRTKVMLTTNIVDGDEAALRLAAYLGFHVDDSGLGMPAYSHHGRRRLARYVRTNPDLLQPLGRGRVVAMGYHPHLEMV